MPTALSSTESSRRTGGSGAWEQHVVGPLVDTGHLLAFRAGSVRRPRALRLGWGVLGAITLAVVLVPALVSERGADPARVLDVLILLPTFMVGFLTLAVVSSVASGGGRELLAGEQAVAFPVSPTTDHLGALLMAPLNIAWLLQAWFLLGAASWATGFGGALVPLQVVLLLWLVLATATAQAVGWTLESVRRRQHGIAALRVLGLGCAGVAVWVQLTGRWGDLLDEAPTLHLVTSALGGFTPRWAGAVLLEAVAIVAVVALGAWPAHVAARRLARDEQRFESLSYPGRPTPRTDLAMLVRIDRASVWRTVPMRRGLTVLAVGPGLVALAGALSWDMVVVLPGLVVSGGVLLFGVNAWSLDGRGGLWRESLPVDPAAVFRARSAVLAEWLLSAALVTVVLASLRAGVPSATEVAALLCCVVVVTAQVVAVAMTWSLRRPFSVDLRSARATPAPPVVMVGYSARLATSTTMTAMVFSTLSWTAPWWVPVLVAVPFLGWSAVRWHRAARRWLDPAHRALVVTTVAA
ncbi:hypothetical protein [Nocardioides campestrisoli]|uniref:hypothetical protein n=1 Tax=Nocardioides campestrisoli TaxID=2736757 RepID=UPI0015E77BB0|nr:hypothetical protein [Nocardioides campestrisoli]